jgi:restriction system protein
MGYAESKEDLKHTGKSNDKGIDGIVYEDKLGLGKIFIQTKRYDLNNTIDKATLHQFVGAIPAGFNKGIFVTLSKFNKNAVEYIQSGVSGKNIVLIDGEKLGDLLYDYKIGLQTKTTLDINKIDLDYFEE